MEYTEIIMAARKRIAVVAHDKMKPELFAWVEENRELLSRHTLYATGTTGRLLEERVGIPVHRLESGPLGGDQQLGAKIAEAEIDILLFFWDPLEAQPHDPDVRALLRIAAVWNVPVAQSRASADFMVSSPLMGSEYPRRVRTYEEYRGRKT